MIRSLIFLGVLLSCAWAQEVPDVVVEGPASTAPDDTEAISPEDTEATAAEDTVRLPDTSIQRYRSPVEALTERAIGRTSRRVRYDWRRSSAQVGLLGSIPAEFNNFDALRAGGFVRMPMGMFLLDFGLSYVWVDGTESTERLALTPYRQAGRPDRFELHFTFNYPVAEGVITLAPRFMPSAELVFNAIAEVRYLVYPEGYAGLGFKGVLKTLIAPSLLDEELANLEDSRLPGMQIDPGRYGTLVGVGSDVYFQSGFFFGYKALVVVPLFVITNGSELGFGFELNLLTGYSF